jgi:hypothetical protein
MKIFNGVTSSLITSLMIITLVLPCNVLSAFATASESAPAQTNVKHNQLKYVIPGKRIAVEAKITDPEGIKLARCYFKSAEEDNYVFVPMTASGSTYNAVLPAPSDKTTGLKYVFLSVNSRNQVARTQEFEVPVDKDKKGETPKWQMDKDKQPVKVNVETSKAPSKVAGFSDSIKCDAVESAARFGLVVGLGGAAAAAAAGGGGGGAAAASGTTVTATSTGMSTTAIVATAGAIAAAATVGGVAASGGGGGGSATSSKTLNNLTAADIVGTWNLSGTMNELGGSQACTVSSNVLPINATYTYLSSGVVNYSFTFQGTTINGSSNWEPQSFSSSINSGPTSVGNVDSCGNMVVDSRLTGTNPLSISTNVTINGARFYSVTMTKTN